MNPGSDGGQTGTGMFSVKGSTFTGYDGDGVIAEAGEGYVNRPGGVDGAVIENNTFDLGVASDTLTGTTQPIVIDADQGSTTTSVLISGNSVTTKRYRRRGNRSHYRVGPFQPGSDHHGDH